MQGVQGGKQAPRRTSGAIAEMEVVEVKILLNSHFQIRLLAVMKNQKIVHKALVHITSVDTFEYCTMRD